MAFPRSFKKETWYLRLPSGEIEVATATALQRAFECGLVDLRTPVRAFGTHTWTTMQEAAELTVPSAIAMTSLSPTALDTPAADLDGGAPWRSRTDVDPKAFQPSRIPAVLGLLASAALLGIALLQGERMKTAAAAAAMAEAPAQPPPPEIVSVPKLSRAPLREQEHTPNKSWNKFSKEQRHRLAELDYVTRTQRPKSSIAKPLVSKPAPDDPFRSATRAPTRGDPLDGSI